MLVKLRLGARATLRRRFGVFYRPHNWGASNFGLALMGYGVLCGCTRLCAKSVHIPPDENRKQGEKTLRTNNVSLNWTLERTNT